MPERFQSGENDKPFLVQGGGRGGPRRPAPMSLAGRATDLPTGHAMPKRARPRAARFGLHAAAALLAMAGAASHAAEPIASLDIASYMGTWYQVAHYPNRFQRQCVRDTSATYRLDGNEIEVVNRCTTADGSIESVTGLARPRDATIAEGRLQPASLEVSFLPAWLRWLPWGWGRYEVISLSPDQRVAIVSEPSQKYLWVLSRDRALDGARWSTVQEFLREAGFDLGRLVRDPVTP
jgi:apolipoprotein D and lipocalin family protein